MMYFPPLFEEADALCEEIMAFLLECGGVYTRETGDLQIIILKSIANGQYVLYREDGKIVHWLCYWKIKESDIEDIGQTMPVDIITGNVLYIAEHGNKEGRKGMTKMIKELRHRATGMQGVLWNSKGRGIKKFMH